MPPIRRSIAVLAFLVPCLALAVVLGATRAHAEADEVTKLINLVREKPASMDRAEWKDKRRTAAKRLGKLGDKRAVPALIQVVETEEFDVVAEHAIVSLGKLGDKRAVPALQRIYGDRSRDRLMRTLAKKALKKLGAGTGTGPRAADSGDTGVGGTSTGADGTSGGSSSTSGGKTVAKPQLTSDTLAATERLTFAIGAARLAYNTIVTRPSLDGNIAAAYERTRERKTSAYRYGAEASLVGGVVEFEGPDSGGQLWNLQLGSSGEARFYSSSGGLFGAGTAKVGADFIRIKIDRPGDGSANDTKDKRFGADLQLGLAVGYGRVLDVGEALRLRRIEAALHKARALGRPIAPDLAERIMLAWWTLRAELGYHRRLLKTIAMLRSAGVLLGEPDTATTYRVLRILEDGQLDHRLQGWDFRMGVTESYLIRDDALNIEDGRIETAVASARYGKQTPDGTRELLGEGFVRYRLFAKEDENDPTPWAVGAAGAWRHYFYNNHFDPLGALEVAADIGMANDDLRDSRAGFRLGGRVAWIWASTRASRFRLSSNLRYESGEIFFGASIEATYGFLDVGYVGAGAYSSVGSGAKTQ